ncbi:MAG: hypothetical protein H7Y17_13790 [Chlorobia bacterium]|nr:hypothetical protein [Fimbriimonadaceae bacterium]
MTNQTPPRSANPFAKEPGYFPSAGLWFYGNIHVLRSELAYVPAALGPDCRTPSELDRIASDAEHAVLNGDVLVCGVHNDAHRRAAIVPLRWGSPRIVVLSGGFRHHLGENLRSEPFRAARLWRYEWDPITDLAISRRRPDSKPTFSLHNPTIDRLIADLAEGRVEGLCGIYNPYPPILRE